MAVNAFWGTAIGLQPIRRAWFAYAPLAHTARRGRSTYAHGDDVSAFQALAVAPQCGYGHVYDTPRMLLYVVQTEA